MSYLKDPAARAINPAFERIYKACLASADKVRSYPIAKEDTKALKDALAVFGIETGADLGRVLYNAGLLEGKDEGTTRGAQLMRDLTKLSFEQIEAIVSYVESVYKPPFIMGYNRNGLTSDSKEVLAYDTLLKLPNRLLATEAAEELLERAVIEGVKMLDSEHRTALLLTLEGYLKVQYPDYKEGHKDAEQICKAMDIAEMEKGNALRCLAQFIAKEDSIPWVRHSITPSEEQEAALNEYTSPR